MRKSKPKLRPYQIEEQRDFSGINLQDVDFEGVEFRNCIFDNLSEANFTDCLFAGCNLSNVPVNNTRMQNVCFQDCKLSGINFFETADFCFNVHFGNCILDYTGFERKKLYKSSFLKCKIHEANFTGADLSETTIENCDFQGTVFGGTNLSAVDFSTNYNFMIDPTANYIRKAVFSNLHLSGLLRQFDIIIREDI